MKRVVPASLAILALAGCSNLGSASKPLIENKTYYLTSRTTLSSAGVVQGALALAAIQLIYDPLAPNWEIEEQRVSEDSFRFALRMKRYTTGGAGEAAQVLKRRASELQRELGYGGYTVLEYNEGIESETLGARRVAAGAIRLVDQRGADSFMLNPR